MPNGAGYTKPPQNQSNGVYFAPICVSSEGLSDAQSRKLDEDIDECKDLHVSAIDLGHQTQLGNPEFYGDPEVALIDCLHRGNLMPKDYTINKHRTNPRCCRPDWRLGSHSGDSQTSLPYCNGISTVPLHPPSSASCEKSPPIEVMSDCSERKPLPPPATDCSPIPLA